MAQVVDEYNVSTEHWCNTNDKIKVKYLEKSLSQCQFVTRTITEPHVIHTHIGIQSDVAKLVVAKIGRQHLLCTVDKCSAEFSNIVLMGMKMMKQNIFITSYYSGVSISSNTYTTFHIS